MTFTIGPICISTTLDNQNRSYYFTIYAAYSTLGVGIGPLFARIFSEDLFWTYKDIFILAACTNFISFIIARYSSYKSTSYKSSNQETNLKGFKELIYILKSPSVYVFIMVFLGACIYTTIINLQTTFAKSQGLDYVYFYFFYSLAVVFARFFISKPLNLIEPKRSISFLLILMIVGLIFMCFAIDSIILYIAGALLLGLGYGLVYPIIQAQATNYSSKSMQELKH